MTIQPTLIVATGLAHHRFPIELLLFSASEVEQCRHGTCNGIAEAFRYGRLGTSRVPA